MAFSTATKRKEVKKSSYYVWFLGAKESRGLRGEEYVWPAVHYLTERENDVEPIKVTLQVSSKGLKIIQNVSRSSHSGKAGAKSETSKHFIPDHSITCVVQDNKPNDDVVAAILLIFNPVSKCPVHVHAYRCDSVETATLLRQHLQILVERPENQRKFLELERRLQAKGLLAPSWSTPTRLNSDGRSTRTESDSSGGSGGGSSDRGDIYALDERMANLYDSLAAELREKLNNKKNNGPLLLPPRDYDTVHRMRGNLEEVEKRRSSQLNVAQPGTGHPKRNHEVGHAGGEIDSSGKSSGIGSDEAPSSPMHERPGYRNPQPPAAPKSRKNPQRDSSSDEEWEQKRQPHDVPAMVNDEIPSLPRGSRGPGGAVRGRENGRRSPSPPSSMHPPSPKPPPYRERYYEGEWVNGTSGQHSQMNQRADGAPGVYPDRNGEYATHHQTKSRTSAPPIDDYDHPPPRDRPLRRAKSRDDKDYGTSTRRSDTSHRMRSDHDTLGRGRDPIDRSPPTTMPHQQISHSRSYDLLTDKTAPQRENGHRYRFRENGNQWTVNSYKDHERHTKSPPSSRASPPECNGYIPLPRVRRVDSGHSSGNTHHSAIDAYQELPDEKRYPGLDRETARLHHQQQQQYATSGGPSKVRDYDHVREPRENSRYTQMMSKPERSSSGHHGRAYCDTVQSTEHRRPDKGTISPASQGVLKHPNANHHQPNSAADEKRFYRYSSSDLDGHYGNRKMASTGYRY